MAKRYTAKFKFQVVMEVLTGEKSAGQVAKVYGVHPNTINLEKGAEVFAQDSMVAEYERRIAEMERLLGKKEVEIALFENFLGQAK